ncbi:DNA polymerase III subunit [Bulleidia sp. zg-1006]|uniref:DNA polymerase III subunit n=1 Tax=Bulleidia sp. zg-1006 TaxID=2806552 RepID=UPI001939439E|nr:DNA polymerase III subunit [Bulleidia sp. zg-1006]QRG86723.1 DNA polymerase III subunit [Bulleidia sp. zg-1006]
MLNNPALIKTLAYQQIEKALKNQDFSHAYLFVGDADQDIRDLATFFAQSLLCTEENVACGNCRACERAAQGLHPDYQHLNGEVKAISKKEMDDLQSYFSKTAVENPKGRRVCYLEHMETASLSAQNSLLKFLEEPADNVVIILSAPKESSILSTLVSRCIPIHFQSVNREILLEKALTLGYSKEDAYFLSLISQSEEDLKQNQEREEYKKAIAMLKESLENPQELLVDYHISFKPKDKENHLFLLNAYFHFVAQTTRQALLKEEIGPAWLMDYMQKKEDDKLQAKVYALMMEALDCLNKYNDPTLLFEQTIYQWRILEK